jgi:hypothetical protein
MGQAYFYGPKWVVFWAKQVFYWTCFLDKQVMQNQWSKLVKLVRFTEEIEIIQLIDPNQRRNNFCYFDYRLSKIGRRQSNILPTLIHDRPTKDYYS